ncbi:unnamed protein product [Prorocentrum cordatum]|uniref:Uncharacterized protein n=1 Tax=Prorocentrum cordatum TaxID=2364126 RepID=A0ABN9S9U1_9DINO|nr:unnamed protein product [Polarella glacialis]
MMMMLLLMMNKSPSDALSARVNTPAGREILAGGDLVGGHQGRLIRALPQPPSGFPSDDQSSVRSTRTSSKIHLRRKSIRSPDEDLLEATLSTTLPKSRLDVSEPCRKILREPRASRNAAAEEND